MNINEAIRILDRDTRDEALKGYEGDCQLRNTMLEQAINVLLYNYNRVASENEALHTLMNMREEQDVEQIVPGTIHVEPYNKE